MPDRTTKIVLAAIALGVWANLMVPMIYTPARADAESDLRSINRHLDGIESGIDLLTNGVCVNRKLC